MSGAEKAGSAPTASPGVHIAAGERHRAVAVVRRGEQFLIMGRYKRKANPMECSICRQSRSMPVSCPGHHYATLPGGSVEPGETPEQAAVRELAEEATMIGRVERLLWTGVHDDKPDKTVSYFLMRDVEGDPVLGGEELAEQTDDNIHTLVWARLAEVDALGLQPRIAIDVLAIAASV